MDCSSLHPIASLRLTRDDRSSERIVGHLTQLMSEIQRMIDSLNQGVTQDFDLTAELRALQAAYERVGNPRMTLALHPAAIEVLTQQEAKEILHIVREALGARVREAQVTHATVSIRKRGARICLRISDDGTGFVPVDGQMPTDSLALIESRARKLGGIVRTQVEEG
ncbi:MAG TPA: hypothetical protein VFX56_09665, partial [Nitrospira sp.]|nr:hypothetical protein [Nitrospira sp.]